jgi:hypothetical protein
MASDASDILEYVVWLVWTFLTLTPAKLKNPVHAIILTTQDVVEKLMSDSLLAFAPGLWDIVLANAPPSIAYFKSLPTYCVMLWAVYVIVLEKRRCRLNIYIGSGTDKVSGAARLQQYDNMVTLPRYVKAALDDGYTITYKGLLCWAPLPTAATRFALRVLFLALESAFSITFWAMYSKTKDYGMPQHLCPWEIDALDYDGLCSHAAIAEQVAGENTLGLTPEQLEATDAELKQRVSDQKKSNLIWSQEQ